MGFTRKFLSAKGIHETVKRCFHREKFKTSPQMTYSWQDCLMSGLAIFGLKFPSLLQFDKAAGGDATIRRN